MSDAARQALRVPRLPSTLPLRLGLALVLAIAISLAGLPRERAWPDVKNAIRARFPDVPAITVEDLARLQQRSAAPLLLLDVRTPQEFAVSHLPGARRVDPSIPDLNLPEDRPVIAYCAVGYRSAALVSRLRAAGHRNVYNLEGSIFEWANQGRPLERDGLPATKVHPFDSDWGRLLRPELHATTP